MSAFVALCPASPTLQNWLCAPATRESFSGAGGAGSTRPPGSSTFGVSPGSPASPPWLSARRPEWAQNQHSVGELAPQSSAPKSRPTCGSRAAHGAGERSRHPRARVCAATSAAPGGRFVSAAARPLTASNAFAPPHAILSTSPVLVGSTRCAPFPLAPRPPMKPDIPTLHKPDILILQRQHPLSH